MHAEYGTEITDLLAAPELFNGLRPAYGGTNSLKTATMNPGQGHFYCRKSHAQADRREMRAPDAGAGNFSGYCHPC